MDNEIIEDRVLRQRYRFTREADILTVSLEVDPGDASQITSIRSRRSVGGCSAATWSSLSAGGLIGRSPAKNWWWLPVLARG
jgi:hypothetical protein